MLKAALFGGILAAFTVSAAWALPATPVAKLNGLVNSSDVTEVGRRDRKWRRHWRGHRGKHWRRGWHHGGRYWRHRYHYRPRYWQSWGCIHVGPVWYCP